MKRRSIALEARGKAEDVQERLERLRVELAELQASRRRLVLAADTERCRIERALHEGVQQQLIALAVNLQLAGRLASDDPSKVGALLDVLARDAQEAAAEAAQLAERIYPPLLETGGLAAALRTVAVRPGGSVSVEVAAGVRYPAEISRTVYLCCLEAFTGADPDAPPPKVTVRGDEEALVFEVVEDGAQPRAGSAGSGNWINGLRDRVEALGGQLTVRSEPGLGVRVSGSLPVSR
jgi:signal transduction histidine kinase